MVHKGYPMYIWELRRTPHPHYRYRRRESNSVYTIPEMWAMTEAS